MESNVRHIKSHCYQDFNDLQRHKLLAIKYILQTYLQQEIIHFIHYNWRLKKRNELTKNKVRMI